MDHRPISNLQPHTSNRLDDFLVALQDAAVSYLDLIHPPVSAPSVSRSLSFAQPISSNSAISHTVSQQLPVPSLDGSSWHQGFDEGTFPIVHVASCEGFAYQDSLPERIIEDNSAISPNHAQASQWVNLHSLESLHNSFDIDDSWLDSLALISSPNQIIHTSSDSVGGTSTSSISSHGDDEVCTKLGTQETFQVTKVQSAAHEVWLSGSPVSEKKSIVSRFFDSTDLSSRKRRRISDPAEPRYMFVTRSNEDVLDDGFKWRKYGRKSVKSSIYPRSYYKCSYGSCHAQKQVQRSALDHSFLLTTYHGRHGHRCPSTPSLLETSPETCL